VNRGARAARIARSAGVIASTGVLAVALTACSGTKHARPSAAPAAVSSSQPIPHQAAPPPPTSLPTYSQYLVPALVPDDPAKRKQVHIDSCASTGSSATAAGTIHNSGNHSASYDITVFFTSDTATAVNYATASVTVERRHGGELHRATLVRRPRSAAVRARRRQLSGSSSNCA
jgi:hypothetical protein